MSRRSNHTDTDLWPDNWKEWTLTATLVGGLAVMLLLIVFNPGVLVGSGQEFWSLVAPSTAGPTPLGGEVVGLTTDDAEFMNRNYREQRHMQAYCGLLDDDSEMRVWAVEVDRSSPTSISFSVENCPIRQAAGWAIILTHPNGNPIPTQADLLALDSVDANYLCIQNAPITTTSHRVTDKFRCYQPGDGSGTSLREITVMTTT